MTSPRRETTSDPAVGVAPDGRSETVSERADRNWNDVLQELRVLQTGTQILTGFLLAVAFQPAFDELTGAQRVFYLVLLVLAAFSAIIALAPVAMHRSLFRRLAKPDVVVFGHRALVGALATVGVLLVGVVALVFDVVLGFDPAWVAAAGLGAAVIILWLAVPAYLRSRHSRKADQR
ncbi:DUF6328 family protein [Microbacterium sp. bgisy207]|jgi:hypothetical protein|uniref:DUF6328 family protein n=1 Tax=Microbacterium sp. bgisy207 TaxID=3413800 RepID=UPI003EC0E50F